MSPTPIGKRQRVPLRKCELDEALAQSRADLAAGRFVTESAQAHSTRLDALLVTSEPEPPTPTQKADPRRKG